jgi:hypothetical protein
MNNRLSKKWRRRFYKQIDAASNMTLKKEIFRLARNRDILGLLLIIESLISLIFIIAAITR